MRLSAKSPGRSSPSSAGSWLPAIGIGLAVAMIGGLALAMPQVALSASLKGLAVWWDVLFPALFPFFVLSDMLLGFGVVHLTGKLLDPFMRPLFRVPGAGGFVVAMGFASGYPVGAKLTSRLMEENLVDRDEGERLVAMTTSSDPIFLIGAVCIGFFGRADIVPVLAAAHYGGAILMGLLLRGKGGAKPGEAAAGHAAAKRKGGRLREAVAAMHRARLADGRPFGLMLQQSLESSIRLMIVVGGLVVFFSAALELLLQSGLLEAMRDLLAALLRLAGVAPGLADSLVRGAFEVTLGARAAAQGGASGMAVPLLERVAAAAFVLSWGGLSVHAQVAGLMSGTKWRYGPFLKARLLHSALAVALVFALWPVLAPSSP
ncbi:nucleoside recognition domain-containing protein [Cohnella zeiphila]|uniref:Sporulation integral membrane protein YlbJ n=1 Tax=Cohnella zeiphila TaxID=2761120 RepID=A0A7X0STP1_9BACL|nr:nucleoside recognition domain-containing protein [Cohnella zeiphila]MBB6735932.1 sporulation integral membrane protein YlbJ [Cohnella zeiphila]